MKEKKKDDLGYWSPSLLLNFWKVGSGGNAEINWKRFYNNFVPRRNPNNSETPKKIFQGKFFSKSKKVEDQNNVTFSTV